jgi:hypothetical protein
VSSRSSILCRAAWCAVVLAATACGQTPRPIELREHVDAAGANVDITIRLQPDHRAYAERYQRGAASAVRACGQIFGRVDQRALRLVDPEWRAQPLRDPDPAVLPHVHWWTTTRSMGAELAAARAAANVVVTARLGRSSLPIWFRDGLAETIARRAVVPLFERENLPPGYAFVEARSFGAFVPAFLRIRMMPESDGAPVAAYRREPSAAPSRAAEAVNDDALAGKTVLALATLERWLGAPTVNAVTADLYEEGDNASLREFERNASAASGQDLAWFFDPVFHSAAQYDYGVQALRTAADPDGSFTTTVAVQRKGDGQFTGTTAPRVGPYESGRGITLEVSFADGQTRVDHWDGRDTEKTFRYRSASPATAAVVDPDRVLMLDVNQTNNSAAIGAASRQPLEWAARFLLWLSNALLTYAALV